MFYIAAATPMIFAVSLAATASTAPQRLDENDQPVPREASQPMSKSQHQHAKRHRSASHVSVTTTRGAPHDGCVDAKTHALRKCPPAMLAPSPIENEK